MPREKVPVLSEGRRERHPSRRRIRRDNTKRRDSHPLPPLIPYRREKDISRQRKSYKKTEKDTWFRWVVRDSLRPFPLYVSAFISLLILYNSYFSLYVSICLSILSLCLHSSRGRRRIAGEGSEVRFNG